MNKISQCEVELGAPELIGDIEGYEYKQSGDGCLGVFVAIAACVGLYIAFANYDGPEDIPSWLWITPVVVGPVAGVWLVSAIRDKRLEKLRAKKNENAKKNAIRKASSDTSRLISGHKDILSGRQRLAQTQSSFVNSVNYVRSQYRNRAFAAYWDGIRDLVDNLNSYKQLLDSVRGEVRSYDSLRSSTYNNFPPQPLEASGLPDAEYLIKIFLETVQLGQTDFEFATIWEQRRTQEILIAGFNTLENGVKGVGPLVKRSHNEILDEIRKISKQ